jgi:hypothetical protein
VTIAGYGTLKAEPYPYCAEFGKRLDATVLVFSASGGDSTTAFCVADDSENGKGPGNLALDIQNGASLDGRRYCW